MINEQLELECILKELEELEKAKVYIDKLKLKDNPIFKNHEFIGKKFKMLTVLEKTDKRANNRKYII